MTAGAIGRLVVDGTGVGRALVDMIEAAGLSPLVVYITAGAKIRREGRRMWTPKGLLLRPLVTGIEGGSVRVAAGLADGPAFVREMGAFKQTLRNGGRVAYEGGGEHDDLVIASALAVLGSGDAEWDRSDDRIRQYGRG